MATDNTVQEEIKIPFKILQGKEENLSSVKAKEGQCYLTTDTHKFYVDIKNGDNIERVELTGQSKNIITGTSSGNTQTSGSLQNGSVYLNHVYNNSEIKSSVKITGEDGMNVTAASSGSVIKIGPSINAIATGTNLDDLGVGRYYTSNITICTSNNLFNYPDEAEGTTFHLFVFNRNRGSLNCLTQLLIDSNGRDYIRSQIYNDSSGYSWGKWKTNRSELIVPSITTSNGEITEVSNTMVSSETALSNGQIFLKTVTDGLQTGGRYRIRGRDGLEVVMPVSSSDKNRVIYIKPSITSLTANSYLNDLDVGRYYCTTNDTGSIVNSAEDKTSPTNTNFHLFTFNRYGREGLSDIYKAQILIDRNGKDYIRIQTDNENNKWSAWKTNRSELMIPQVELNTSTGEVSDITTTRLGNTALSNGQVYLESVIDGELAGQAYRLYGQDGIEVTVPASTHKTIRKVNIGPSITPIASGTNLDNLGVGRYYTSTTNITNSLGSNSNYPTSGTTFHLFVFNRNGDPYNCLTQVLIDSKGRNFIRSETADNNKNKTWGKWRNNQNNLILTNASNSSVKTTSAISNGSVYLNNVTDITDASLTNNYTILNSYNIVGNNGLTVTVPETNDKINITQKRGKMIVGSSPTSTSMISTAASNGGVYLNYIDSSDDSTFAKRSSIKITGSGTISVTAAASTGNITIKNTANTAETSGYVAKPSGANKVWRTNSSGNPVWSDSVPKADAWTNPITLNGISINSNNNNASRVFTTPEWGQYAAIKICPSDKSTTSSYNGSVVYFNGKTVTTEAPSSYSTLAIPLPSTFKGNITGNAATATTATTATTANKLTSAQSLKIGNTPKNFDGSAGLTWTHAEIGYADSGKTGLLSSGTQTISGAKTFAGNVSVNLLTITNTSGKGHITFSRESSPNYLHVPFDTGSIALCANASLNIANSALIVSSESASPGKTKTYNLGTSENLWNNLYINQVREYSHQYIFHSSLTKGTAPSSLQERMIAFHDSTGDTSSTAKYRTGMLYNAVSSSSTATTAIYAYDVTQNTTTKSARIYVQYTSSGTKAGSNAPFYGAVWNDYAEFRQYKDSDKIPYGRIVVENGDDTLSLSTERLQKGGNVCSDTFGFAIGETEQNTMPIAVSGRALVYTYEPRETYKPGEAVCTAPNGTISRMTREEIKEYPDCIVGYVSAIPDYEVWGENNTIVDNRIWIKVV